MKKIYSFISKDESETKLVGVKASQLAKENYANFIFLIGDLGIGKTIFTKGIAEELKVKDKITSPTFGYRNEYSFGDKKLVHYDLYRSESKKDAKEMLNEDFYNDGLVVIEWPDKVDLKPIKNETLIVKIKRKGKFDRSISIYKA